MFMGEERIFEVNDTTRGIEKEHADLLKWDSPLCDKRIKAMILTKLEEAALLSLKLIKVAEVLDNE